MRHTAPKRARQSPARVKWALQPVPSRWKAPRHHALSARPTRSSPSSSLGSPRSLLVASVYACGGGNDNLPPPPPPPPPPASASAAPVATTPPASTTPTKAPAPPVTLTPGAASPDPAAPHADREAHRADEGPGHRRRQGRRLRREARREELADGEGLEPRPPDPRQQAVQGDLRHEGAREASTSSPPARRSPRACTCSSRSRAARTTSR